MAPRSLATLARVLECIGAMQRWMVVPVVPVALVVLVVLAPRSARADPELVPISASPEDEPQLYHCKHKVGQVSVTFKPETGLDDLVTWAMGFTCHNFMYDPSYVQRGKKVRIIVPTTMTAHEAYQVFLGGAVDDGAHRRPEGQRVSGSSKRRPRARRPCRSCMAPRRTPSRSCASCCARRTRRWRRCSRRSTR